MSTAAAGSAAAAQLDPLALQVWVAEVEGRLDAQATRMTGVNLELQQLVGHARDAMKSIVDGVAGELLCFKRQVHIDH